MRVGNGTPWYDGPSSFHGGVVDAEEGRGERLRQKRLKIDVDAATKRLERDLELAKQQDEDRVREIRRQGEQDARAEETHATSQRLNAQREEANRLGLEQQTADQRLREEAARAFEENGGSVDDATPFMGPPAPRGLSGEDNHVLATVTRMQDREGAKQILGVHQLKKQLAGQQQAAQAALTYIGSLAKGQKDAEGEDIPPLLGEEEFQQLTDAIGAWQQSGGTAGLDPSQIVPQLIELEQAERKRHQYRKTGFKAAAAMRARIDAEIANPDSLIDPDNLVAAGILLDGWVSHDGMMFDEEGDPSRMMREVRETLTYGRGRAGSSGTGRGRSGYGQDDPRPNWLKARELALEDAKAGALGSLDGLTPEDADRRIRGRMQEYERMLAGDGQRPGMPISTSEPGTLASLRESNPTAYMDQIGKLAELKARGASREEFEAFAKQTGTDLANLGPQDRAAIEEAMKGLQRTGQNATLEKNKSGLRKMLDGGEAPRPVDQGTFSEADQKRLAQLEAKSNLRPDEEQELAYLRRLREEKGKPKGTRVPNSQVDELIRRNNEAARDGR